MSSNYLKDGSNKNMIKSEITKVDLNEYKIPDPKEIDYFEYRDQFYDADAFREVEAWSKMATKKVFDFNKAISLSCNSLIDSINKMSDEIIANLIANKKDIEELRGNFAKINGMFENLKNLVEINRSEVDKVRYDIENIKKLPAENRSVFDNVQSDLSSDRKIEVSNNKNILLWILVLVSLSMNIFLIIKILSQ